MLVIAQVIHLISTQYQALYNTLFTIIRVIKVITIFLILSRLIKICPNQ